MVQTDVRTQRKTASWRDGIGRAYEWAARLVAAGIAAQVFLAGLNVFLRPVYWGLHINLGHAVGGVVMLMLVLALAGRLAARVRWGSALMLLLFGLQYNARALAGLVGVPELSALHAVNALALFWLALALARRARSSDAA
jgi:hypothetical protein